MTLSCCRISAVRAAAYGYTQQERAHLLKPHHVGVTLAAFETAQPAQSPTKLLKPECRARSCRATWSAYTQVKASKSQQTPSKTNSAGWKCVEQWRCLPWVGLQPSGVEEYWAHP